MITILKIKNCEPLGFFRANNTYQLKIWMKRDREKFFEAVNREELIDEILNHTNRFKDGIHKLKCTAKDYVCLNESYTRSLMVLAGMDISKFLVVHMEMRIQRPMEIPNINVSYNLYYVKLYFCNSFSLFYFLH